MPADHSATDIPDSDQTVLTPEMACAVLDPGDTVTLSYVDVQGREVTKGYVTVTSVGRTSIEVRGPDTHLAVDHAGVVSSLSAGRERTQRVSDRNLRGADSAVIDVWGSADE